MGGCDFRQERQWGYYHGRSLVSNRRIATHQPAGVDGRPPGLFALDPTGSFRSSDNTTAIGQLRRGRSNAFLANSELRRLKMVIESKHLTITGFQYVRSAENHADYWSREGLRILQLASTEGHGLLEGHRSVPFEDPFASNPTFEAGRK